MSKDEWAAMSSQSIGEEDAIRLKALEWERQQKEEANALRAEEEKKKAERAANVEAAEAEKKKAEEARRKKVEDEERKVKDEALRKKVEEEEARYRAKEEEEARKKAEAQKQAEEEKAKKETEKVDEKSNFKGQLADALAAGPKKEPAEEEPKPVEAEEAGKPLQSIKKGIKGPQRKASTVNPVRAMEAASKLGAKERQENLLKEKEEARKRTMSTPVAPNRSAQPGSFTPPMLKKTNAPAGVQAGGVGGLMNTFTKERSALSSSDGVVKEKDEDPKGPIFEPTAVLQEAAVRSRPLSFPSISHPAATPRLHCHSPFHPQGDWPQAHPHLRHQARHRPSRRHGRVGPRRGLRLRP